MGRRHLFGAVGFLLISVLLCAAGVRLTAAAVQLPSDGSDSNIPLSAEVHTAEPTARVSLTEGTPLDSDAEPDLYGEPVEVTTADIMDILSEYVCADGTRVLFYRSVTGSKYCACIPAGTERVLRFTFEDNCYESGYHISGYENVLGHSGFRIECPRGAAYYALDYYYFDEDGNAVLLAACASDVLETDFDGDGQRELVWSYHGSELYYVYQLDGRLYQADLGAMTGTALGLQQSEGAVALTVPMAADAFSSGGTTYWIVGQGADGAWSERRAGKIRLTADALEIYALPTQPKTPPSELPEGDEVLTIATAFVEDGRMLQIEAIGRKRPDMEQYGVRELRVYEGDTLIQTICVKDAVGADFIDGAVGEGYTDCWSADEVIEVQDVNFDHADDVSLFGWLCNDSIPYYEFLWDSETGQYRYAFCLQGADFDAETQKITCRYRDGQTHYRDVYRYDEAGALTRIAHTIEIE
jgi:hypothetical protein